MRTLRPIGLALVAAGCGGAAERASSPSDLNAEFVRGGSGSATVSYQANARVIERARGLAILDGMSTDGSTLVMAAGARELRGLRPGDVLVVKELLARRVIGADTLGDQVFVLTEPASLGEVIRNGRISLELPVRFGERLAQRSTASRWMLAAGLRIPMAEAQQPDAEKLKQAEEKANAEVVTKLRKSLVKGLFDGWRAEYAVTPGKGRVDVTFGLTREDGGFRGVITGDGYLADFDLSSGIEVDEGIVSRLAVTHKRLNGLMNFRWEVAKNTPGAESRDDRIKLPAALSIPLAEFVGGLPLFLEISAALIVKPAISGGGEYSRGAFRITYDGYQSFVAREGNIDTEGNVTGDIQFVEGQNISALAPHGMVVAVAAPRIELVLGLTRKLDFGDIQKAAQRVDLIADQLAKRLLNPEDYERLKQSPLGGFKLGKAASMAMKSDAAAYVELVSTAGTSFSGMSAIFPCTRTDLALTVRVGASAEAFGQSVGKAERDVFSKSFVRVDPPDYGGLCERAGPSSGEVTGD